MKPERRAELRKIRGAATQGSWVGGPMGVLSGATWVVENTLDDSGDIMGSEDTECIVAAVNALVPLLDALDAAEASHGLMCGVREDVHARAVHQRDALAKRVAELEGVLGRILDLLDIALGDTDTDAETPLSQAFQVVRAALKGGT